MSTEIKDIKRRIKEITQERSELLLEQRSLKRRMWGLQKEERKP